jgi:hypothetical protein
MLASLLSPALKKALQKAVILNCKNLTRQTNMSWNRYLDDYEGWAWDFTQTIWTAHLADYIEDRETVNAS